jgi:hypothetical protein
MTERTKPSRTDQINRIFRECVQLAADIRDGCQTMRNRIDRFERKFGYLEEAEMIRDIARLFDIRQLHNLREELRELLEDRIEPVINPDEEPETAVAEGDKQFTPGEEDETAQPGEEAAERPVEADEPKLDLGEAAQ